MTRLIDADVCIEKIKSMPVTYDAETVQRCIEIVSNAPTIDTDYEDFPKGFFEKPRRQATEEKGFDEKTCVPVTIYYAEPVRRGLWLPTCENHGFDDEVKNLALACSVCHVAFRISDYEQIEDFRYCPNCGARMRGEE